MDRSVLQNASRFIVDTRQQDLPHEVIEISKRAFIDYLGCGIAGSHQPVAEKTRRWSASGSSGPLCSVFGLQKRLPPVNAAFCNAVAGHALDFDDTSWTTIGHPTTVGAPVALAMGEATGASGLSVLKAYAAGVEVGHQLARHTMPETSEMGWHTTPVFGVPIAAATHGYLSDQQPETLTSGLGIALTRSAGFRGNFGSMTKPLHAGLATKSGMEAMELAALGITASPFAFEGTDGFTSCFGGKANTAAIRFGETWDLVESGLAFKRYPCCSGSHPAVDAMGQWVKDRDLFPDQIKSIRVGTSLLSPRELVNNHPRTPLEAKFSMEFALAAILLRRQLTLDEFTPEFVQSAPVQSLMKRITTHVDPDLATLGFIGTAPVKMEIALVSGETVHLSNDLARGTPEKPLEDADHREKFMRNTARILGMAKAQKLLETLFTLETLPSIEEIIPLTA